MKKTLKINKNKKKYKNTTKIGGHPPWFEKSGTKKAMEEAQEGLVVRVDEMEEGLVVRIDEMEKAQGEAQKGLGVRIDEMGKAQGEAQKGMGVRINEMGKAQNDLKEQINEMGEAQREAQNGLKEQIKEMGEAQKKLLAEIESMKVVQIEHIEQIKELGDLTLNLGRMVGVMAMPLSRHPNITLNHAVHTDDEFMFQVIIDSMVNTPENRYDQGLYWINESLIICIYHNRIDMLRKIMKRYLVDTPLKIFGEPGFMGNGVVPHIIVSLLKEHSISHATYSSPHNVTPIQVVKNSATYHRPMFDSSLHMAAAFGRVEIIEIMIGYIAAVQEGVVIPVPSGDNGNKICDILREKGFTKMPRF